MVTALLFSLLASGAIRLYPNSCPLYPCESLVLDKVGNPPGGYAEGTIYYSATDRTLVVQNGIEGVELNVGQEQWLYGYNDTGSEIPNGTVVYVCGAHGNRAKLCPADATLVDAAHPGKYAPVAVATMDIPDKGYGISTTFGIVHGLDTHDYASGTMLYLSASTPGALTGTHSTAVPQAVIVGVVTYSHATDGEVLVKPTSIPPSRILPLPQRWDDLRFPSVGINPPGAPADPTRNTTTGLLQFSGTADNVIAGVAQMPHGWIEGSTIKPHLHLRFPVSASCNTRWRIDYDVASPSGNFTNHSGTYTTGTAATVANPENVDRHVLGALQDIAMSGHTVSANVLWKITRLANSDAADNCTDAVELLDFDIHYQRDALGSWGETTK